MLGSSILGTTAASALEPRIPLARTDSDMRGPDAQLDEIVRKLESLPEDLKAQDPATPGYEERLSKALNGATTLSPEAVQKATGIHVEARSTAGCLKELAVLAVTYGVPATKILKWIREARQLWGGVKGIINAVRSGVAATEMGGEAAALLGALTGYTAVKEACIG